MKNIRKIGFLALATVMAWSCQADFFDVDPPTLNISFADTEKVDLDGVLHVYVNDMVVVNLSGDMDLLYQYSGEKGSEYFMEDEIVTTGGTAMFQTTTTSIAAMTDRQQGNLKTRFSTDFTGVNDSLNINNATWITIPEEDLGYAVDATATLSEWVDIFDYIRELGEDPDDKEYVYFAYQYKSCLPGEYNYALSTTGDTVYYGTVYGNKWIISTFDFRRTYSDGRYQYYGLYDETTDLTGTIIYAGLINPVEWICEGSIADTYAYGSSATHYSCWTMANGSATFNPATTTAFSALDIANDDWIITRRFGLHEPPPNDPSVVLKGTTTVMPETTTLYYGTPGRYELSIVASNLTIKTEELVVKRLTVEVTDPDATEEKDW